MHKAVTIVGSVVVSLVLYSTPIITTIAFLHHWDDFVRWLLFISSGLQLLVLVMSVYLFASEIEDE